MIRSLLMLLSLLLITAAMIAFSWCREVHLTWSANPAPENVERYNLYRSGEVLASTNETFMIANLATGDAVTLTAVNAAGESDPTPPLIIGPPPLDRTGWRVTASSEEIAQEDNRAVNAIDDNEATIWHTTWGAKLPPHYVKIELPRPALVSRLRYLPRQDGGTNGHITAYEVEVSADGVEWTNVISGTWANDATLKIADFGLHSCRFIRLWSATPYACAAEIWLHGTEEPISPAMMRFSFQYGNDLVGWEDLPPIDRPKKERGFVRWKIEPTPP